MNESLWLIFNTIFSIVFMGFMVYGCWISSVMLSERSALRKFTGAYYDFEITEALKEMGMTREQALKEQGFK